MYVEKEMDLALVGDFNKDYNKKGHIYTKELTNLERDFSIEQIVKGPTRCDVKSQSTIDLSFTNVKFAKKMLPVNLNLSDHLLTVLVSKKEREAKRPVLITSRRCNDESMEAYKKDLLDTDWSFVYCQNEPNFVWNKMHEIILKLLDKHCPFRTFKVSRDRLKNEKMKKNCMVWKPVIT